MRWLMMAAVLAVACKSSKEAPPPPAAASPGVDLTPKRKFDADADNSKVEPAAMRQDGDFSVFRVFADKTECGMMYKQVPVEAVYFLCGAEVVAGPLKSPEEINAFSARLQKTIDAVAADKSAGAAEVAKRVRAP